MDGKNWYSFVPLLNSIDRSNLDAEVILSKSPVRDLAGARGKHDPVIGCMSFLTTQAGQVEQLVSDIRSRLGDGVRLVAGGPHATGFPQDTLAMGFDAVVRGEGELVLPDVIKHLTGQGEVPGDWPVVQGKPLDDLDTFPPVSLKYHLFPPIELTRGCMHGCRFCSVPRVFGPVRHRSVGSVLQTARKLLKMRSRWDFRFISPNSLGYGSSSGKPNEEAVERLLSSLRGLEGKKRIYFSTFPSEARPEFVTEGMVGLISTFADNDTISIGAQSGSERILKGIGRGHGMDAVYGAAATIIEGGLKPVVDFILAFPSETEADQEATLRAMRGIVRLGGEVRVHHFLPLGASPMSAMEPSPIAPSVMTEIGRMALRGFASGSFTEQMRLARDISARRKREELFQEPGPPGDC
jgi:B12-binding domain/radical SAM domain protein